MDIPINVRVHCSDGLAGHSSCIIVNPLTRTVTHFVLRPRSMLDVEKLVPVALIKESNPDMILLRCPLSEIVNLDSFNKGHFLGYEVDDPSLGDDSDSKYTPGRIMAWPYSAVAGYGYSSPITAYVVEEQIPIDECPIHRGAEVEATDGWVGRVYEFLVNPESSAITHLVLRENHFWNNKSVTIPVSQIKTIETDRVYLKLDREAVKNLTHLPVH